MTPIFLIMQSRLAGGAGAPASDRDGAAGFGDMLTASRAPGQQTAPQAIESRWATGAAGTDDIAAELVAGLSELAEQMAAGIDGEAQLSPAGLERFERDVSEQVAQFLSEFDLLHGTRTAEALAGATTAGSPGAARIGSPVIEIATGLPKPAAIVSAAITSTLRTLNIGPALAPTNGAEAQPLDAALPRQAPEAAHAAQPTGSVLVQSDAATTSNVPGPDTARSALQSATASAAHAAEARYVQADAERIGVRTLTAAPAAPTEQPAAAITQSVMIPAASIGDQATRSRPLVARVAPPTAENDAAAPVSADADPARPQRDAPSIAPIARAFAPLHGMATPATSFAAFAASGQTLDSGPTDPDSTTPFLPQPPLVAPNAALSFAETTAAQARTQMNSAAPDPSGAGVLDQIKRGSVSEGRTRIELTPAGLGTIEIDLGPDEAGQLRIVVRAESPAVLSMLRSDRAALLTALGDSNAALGDATLDFESFGGQAGDGRSPGTERRDLRGDIGHDIPEVEGSAPSLTPLASPQAAATDRLDIFT
jgi:hypothetical protein